MPARRFLHLFLFFMLVTLLQGCDERRVFEDNKEFVQRYWLVTDEPSFEFPVDDSLQSYNLYYNVRNSIDYRWDRVFVTWVLSDSTGQELSRKLVYNNLFDPTGRPTGESGIGDLYDHQFPVATHYHFPHAGKYKIRLLQFSRQDTLQGILAVGVRVEKDLESQ